MPKSVYLLPDYFERWPVCVTCNDTKTLKELRVCFQRGHMTTFLTDWIRPKVDIENDIENDS